VRYTAQGALISVQAGDSLLDIRDKINAATYAAGNELTASVVDRHLVLAARRTGERFAIRGEDVEGSILASLELLSGGSPVHELQAAQNALITVNGTLTVSRSRNSGLTDVISGVTLDLLKAGTAELTVGVDLSAAQNKIQELVAKFNDAIGYLRAKTGLTLSSSGGYKENRTYSRGTLYGDSLLAGLRYSLHQVLLARYEHGSLAQLGFSIDGTNMTIRLTDSAALSSALANDFQSVAALVKEVAAAVNSALDPYIEDANESIIARRGADLDKQIGMYDKRVKQMQERLQAEETNLRNQYYRLQQQFVASLQRRQEWLVFGGAGLLGGLLG
jgi:flagellar hook-associated protein 2